MTYQEIQHYLLEERKLTPKTILEHNIAFCSKQGWLYAPTTYPKEFNKLPEFYFDSLIFPVYDLYGESIAIQTRRMYKSDNKYVNSANSNLYTKGRHLYGLNLAWPHILKENRVIVTEGLFDAIQLRQAGILNVVALMGTTMSETQASLLKRFTDTIIFLMDPDIAGKKAAYKHEYKFLKHVKVLNVCLPEPIDPDEFVIKHGAEKLKQLICT